MIANKMYSLKILCHLFLFYFIVSCVRAHTYSVKIGTEQHVNLIESRFLSFTIDPKYLFSSNDKYNSKECLCMASALTPAYIRIAGPSTSLLTFHNTTISLDDPEGSEESPKKTRLHSRFSENLSRIDQVIAKRRKSEAYERFKRDHDRIEISHTKWRRFVHWANRTGFSLVFALNHQEKTPGGLWDPHAALTVLTEAERAAVDDVYWQLGYECKNQSIEEYLNDLETLRVITETFPGGERWKVVGGDVTGCLQEDSKSDFKDYVMLSNDMFDAVMLDGNSSSHELSLLTERDRLLLLKTLSESSTPLWLSERPAGLSPLARAADWLAGLGHAARNGFSVHYRELSEEELFEPSLSFYMALLYKNLVGGRVLHAALAAEQVAMFAHCTSLRRRAVPGAVTLYAVNMDEEAARFSVKLGQREEGGDVLQFVLAEDASGNIIVNGKPMYFEGDIKPVVKRVRPYKTLLVNLPPKSFGFWVLANTNVEACYEEDDRKIDLDDEEEVLNADENPMKTKRSADFDDYTFNADITVDFYDEKDTNGITNEALMNRLNSLNMDLSKVHELFKKDATRTRRQTGSDRKVKRQNKLKHLQRLRDDAPTGLKSRIFQFVKRNVTRLPKFLKRKPSRYVKLHKRHSKKQKQDVDEKLRTRRSTDDVETSTENDIDFSDKDSDKLWNMLRKVHRQLKDLSHESVSGEIEDLDIDRKRRRPVSVDSDEPLMTVKDTNILKSTVENLLVVMSDLNKNLGRFWNAVNILD